MTSRLYVGNLPFSATEDEVLQLFKQMGHVVSCNLIVDRTTDRSKGFAFVEMASPDEAQTAISLLNGREMNGRRLTVNEAKPREEHPRSEFANLNHGGASRYGRTN